MLEQGRCAPVLTYMSGALGNGSFLFFSSPTLSLLRPRGSKAGSLVAL